MDPRKDLFNLPPQGQRTCPKCGHEGPDEDFNIGTVSIKGKRNARMAKCKKCHTERLKRTARVKMNVRMPTPGDGHRCDCCGCGEDDFRPKGKWCVDHDDNTGKFRGIVCQPCNLGIGQFSDDPLKLIMAAQYLVDCERDEDYQ